MANTPSNTDDIIQISDIIERIEELEEVQTPCIVAGSNMAGYMPDNIPAEFDAFDGAKASIIETLEHDIEAIDDAALIDEMEKFKASIEALEEDEFSLTGPNHVCYWVKDTGEKRGLDEGEIMELADLNAFMEEMKGAGGDEKWRGDWYPQSAIREDYFETAMDELLEEIGEIPENLPSYMTITLDYDALQQDYTSAEFDGVTYYFR